MRYLVGGWLASSVSGEPRSTLGVDQPDHASQTTVRLRRTCRPTGGERIANHDL